MKLYGVIDLGTNTFHLLIARVTKKGIKEVYRERVFVQLADAGIETIGKAPFNRAVETIARYKIILDKHGVSNIKAFGTAGLRTASNGATLIQTIFDKTGIQVELITGMEEARLISLGVQQVVALSDHNSLIMDIGGGSVEFIIANQHQVIWSQSFPIGVAVLYNQFHQNDPITVNEIEQIHIFLHQILEPLKAILSEYPTQNLVGASGTFDVLEKVLEATFVSPQHSIIDVALFKPFYKKIIHTKLEERLVHRDIPNSRAKLIVVALILIDVVIKMTNIKQIDISAYAMKEGILSEMANLS